MERSAAALATERAHRELAAAQLSNFADTMASDQLADRLGDIRTAMAQSPEAAETVTLELAADLHRSLSASRSSLY